MQRLYLEAQTDRDIVLKGRQLGFSTLKLLQLLDKALFTPNVTCVIVAHKEDSMRKLFRIIKLAFDNLEIPKPTTKYDNRNELFFEETNSNIYVSTEVRGDTVDHLHISEMAFIKDAEEKMLGSFNAVPDNGTICIESTANGIGNYFHEMYSNAKKRGFKSHFFPWFLGENYVASRHGVHFTDDEIAYQAQYDVNNNQLAWRKKKLGLLGEDGFKQEFPSNDLEAFISTGQHVFSVKNLYHARENWVMDPLPDNKLGFGHMYKKPDVNSTYFMGIDFAEGINKDNCALDIIDHDSGEQVFHIAGQYDFDEWLFIIKTLWGLYNRPFVTPEANNQGYGFIKALREIRGFKMYRSTQYDRIDKERSKRIGFYTSAKTKDAVMKELSQALNEGDILIRDADTIDEMITFIREGRTKLNASPGKKDDRVISIALAWHGSREFARKEERRLALARTAPRNLIRTNQPQTIRSNPY